MQIAILQENLINGLLKVKNFIDSRAQLPILTNILFVAEKNKLKLSATNLETGINLSLPVKIEKEGKITVPANIIVDFISSLPQDKVFLKTEQTKLLVNCRNYKASFNGISAAEFPAVPSLKQEKPLKDLFKITLKKEDLIKAVNQVAFTAAQDESRPVLAGIKIDFLENKILLAATDGYRLSLKTIKTEQKIKPKTIIVPAKTLNDLIKIAIQEEEKFIDLVLVKEENQAIFNLAEIEIVTRLIEGKFPDLEKIIPNEQKIKITIEKQEFQQAIKAAAILAKNSANIVKLKVSGSKLKISANAPEVGKNEIELEIKKEGEDGAIAFNFRFLQDYLNCLEDKEVILEILGALKPGVFKVVNDASFLHIIMPVRIQD